MSLFHTEKGWFKILEIILGFLNFPQILFLQRRQIGSLADDWTLIKFIIWGHRLFIPDVKWVSRRVPALRARNPQPIQPGKLQKSDTSVFLQLSS